MRNWKHYFGEKDTIVAFIYQLTIGMLGALIMWFVLSAWHSHASPKIGTVNITGLVNSFIKSQVSVPQETLNVRVKEFAKTLDDTLHTVATDQNLVLLPSEAVIAGATDYTDVVKQKMSV